MLTPEGGFEIGVVTENGGWSVLSVCIIAYNTNGLRERLRLSSVLGLSRSTGAGAGPAVFVPLYT